MLGGLESCVNILLIHETPLLSEVLPFISETSTSGIVLEAVRLVKLGIVINERMHCGSYISFPGDALHMHRLLPVEQTLPTYYTKSLTA